MKYRFTIFTFAVGLLFLSGCASLAKKAVLVNPGDTKERVTELMGPPKNRQFNGTDEAWQYVQIGAGFGYNEVWTIWFTDGIVIGMTQRRSGPSEAGFGIREIRWEDKPDTTIEIRNR